MPKPRTRPIGYCVCGCGARTNYDENGQPRKYLRKHKERVLREEAKNRTCKVCSGCGRKKPLEAFWQNAENYDGRKGRCAECEIARREEGIQGRRSKHIERNSSPDYVRPETKKCCRCAKEKKGDEFYRNRASLDGLSSACMDCTHEKNAESRERNHETILEGKRRYYRENKKQVCKQARRWREENPERCKEATRAAYWRNRDKILAMHKKYRESEKGKKSARKWREENRERIRGRSRVYNAELRRKYPERYRAQFHRRRAAMRTGLDGDQWKAIREFYENTCLACGAAGGVTIDHVIPISKGGPNSADNIQPLCGLCNCYKWTKKIDYRDPHLHAQLLTAMELESML